MNPPEPDGLVSRPSHHSVDGTVTRLQGMCGAVIGASREAVAPGLLAGVLGAGAGTRGGFETRARLVRAIGGKDLPIALLEDAIAILGAVGIVLRFS